MNKLDRLAGIVFVLGRKSKVRASELADFFEVSERTIYRDMQTLSELKIPVIAESGVSGGYSIAPDYFLHPVVLTEEETQALYLGCNFIRHQQGFPYAKPAERALEKLTTVISEENIRSAEQVIQKIHYNIPISQASRDLSGLLHQINEYIFNRESVIIQYQTAGGTDSTRQIDIYHLWFEYDTWHIIAYCHLRDEFRQFKLSRIKKITPTGTTFEYREHHQKPSQSSTPENIIKVRVNQNTPASLKMTESHVFRNLITYCDSNYLELTFMPEWRKNDFILSFILGLGPDAEIIYPNELREQFKNILKKMCQVYEISVI